MVRDGVVSQNPVARENVKSGAGVLEQGWRAALLYKNEIQREQEGDVGNRRQETQHDAAPSGVSGSGRWRAAGLRVANSGHGAAG